MAKLNITIFGDQSSPNAKTREILECPSLSQKIIELKQQLATKHKHSTNDLSIIYHGEILKDENTLEEIGIHSESNVYCIYKSEAPILPVPKLNLMELQHLLVALRGAISRPPFRSVVKKLSSLQEVQEFVDKIPSLAQNPEVIAYLQDPDFIISLQNPELLTKIVDEKPVFGLALEQLCKRVKQAKRTSSNQTPSAAAYSMDALSDDDDTDMDTEQSGFASSLLRPASQLQPITPTQLAAALANVTGGPSSSRRVATGLSVTPAGSLTTPSPSSLISPAPSRASTVGGTSSGGGSTAITTEMFNQALQNAFATAASRSTSSTPPSSQSQAAADAAIPNMAESLQLMREMGIGDEMMSIQALRNTNGDVQAAVDLIFAQWMAD